MPVKQYVTVSRLEPEDDPDTQNLIGEWALYRRQMKKSLVTIESEIGYANQMIDYLECKLLEEQS